MKNPSTTFKATGWIPQSEDTALKMLKAVGIINEMRSASKMCVMKKGDYDKSDHPLKKARVTITVHVEEL